jgi:hypothetical protein
MATVRFATTCDHTIGNGRTCGRRSPEYVAYPSCRECGTEVCPDHQEPGSVDDETNRCTCIGCQDVRGAEEV